MLGSKDDRRRNFKKGIDSEAARRKREDQTIELRKSKRDEQIQKRRMASRGMFTDAGAAQAVPAATVDPMMAHHLNNIPTLVAGVHSEDPNVQFECTTQFRKLLSIGKIHCHHISYT